MKKQTDLTRMTLWVNRTIALILAVLLFALPSVLDWYSAHRSLNTQERLAILAAFYVCAVIVFAALWQMDHLLRSVLHKQVFLKENVRRIRIVQWCCAGVSLVCLPAAFIYYPLIFLVVIMGFLCLVVSVICRVMDTAVSLQEENDLTI